MRLAAGLVLDLPACIDRLAVQNPAPGGAGHALRSAALARGGMPALEHRSVPRAGWSKGGRRGRRPRGDFDAARARPMSTSRR
ncbi:hypothetical protein [Paracoccus mutanolyticus]|uniref:hypothetical protein n=1 Tax=Paracoccus mutanolyticus TaxID=1499308 RepID=UPI0011AE7E85|nr:hypothetical protein [Paracoccus mutanolyticus]